MDDKHRIFKQDPAVLMGYVDKDVVVSTVDGVTHRGRVYTVDPVSSTFVLLSSHDAANTTSDCLSTKRRAKLVLGHAVRSIDVLGHDGNDGNVNMDLLFKSSVNVAFTEEELLTRRDKLCAWLTENRFPVEIAESRPDILSVGGDILSIHPPYYADNCLSTNEIILSRIQALIAKIPKA